MPASTVASTAKRIKLDQLRQGMVLANDVVSLSGMVLLTKDTILNNINFTRLEDNNISVVYVKANSIDNSQELFVSDANKKHALSSIPVRDQPEFIEFEKTYLDNKKELKEIILNISDGGNINLDQLYHLTDGVMSQLRYKSDIFSYLNFLKDKDESTFAHSANVSLLANLFGQWLGMDKEEIINLTTAASLHDLGKTQIPGNILNKPDKLTPDEYEIMKKHTIYGYRMLEKQDIAPEIKIAALAHHEKIDGTGYPLGLKDTKISLYAKIVGICDIYDAMTANRVYRKKLCPFDVIKNFEQSSYGLLDTKLLHIFLQNIAYTYVGSGVSLDDGREAKVVFINPTELSRPMVRMENGDIIDLKEARNTKIVSVNS